MKYQIYESSYYNEFGEVKSKHYYIRERRKFLGFEYWKTVKECGWGDCYSTTAHFHSEADALKFIRNVLERKVMREGWKDKLINVLGDVNDRRSK